MNGTAPDTTIDLSPLQPLAAACRRLRAAGWSVTDGVGSVAVEHRDADVAGALADLTDLLPAALNVEVIGERGGALLRLRLMTGALVVVDAPSDDVKELFDDPVAQRSAREAFDGDAAAALTLPMQWTVAGTFDFAKVVALPTGASAVVALTSETVTRYVTDTTTQTVHRLATPGAIRVLAATDALDTVQIGGLVLAGAAGAASGVTELAPVALLDGETNRVSGAPPAGMLVAAPGTAVQQVWQPAAQHVRVLACQLVWQTLATEFTESTDSAKNGATPAVTFHGYKKTTFHLPAAATWTQQQLVETLELRRWALHDASPDRLLAVRQVVSLYDGGSAALHAGDVQASAEVVYTGLRTDAVAEAVKGAREAHAHAQDAARQATKSAHDLLKGATERMLAALIAVGAVLVANAGRTLPDDIGRLLLLLIAVFLVLLAVASLALEGPLLGLPVRTLRDDLKHQPGLLTQEQRDRVEATPSLRAVRHRIRLVRVVVPVAYIAFATLIYVFGHPSRFMN